MFTERKSSEPKVNITSDIPACQGWHSGNLCGLAPRGEIATLPSLAARVQSGMLVCAQCGSLFPVRSGKRFCSRRCAVRFHSLPTAYERTKRHRAVHPDHARARDLVNKAVQDGRMVRPSTCEACGCSCKPDGHHDDYAEPFSVRWLCRSCHQALDGGSHCSPVKHDSASPVSVVRSSETISMEV